MWAALALLALGIGAIVLIAFGVFPQARVTRLIETRAKQALGEQSRIGRMRVVPARGEAEVWDSVIAGPGYRVELPKARFVFGLGALFGGELVIQKLELDNPRVVIDPVTGSGGAKGRPITVLDLRVSHGSLLYKNLAGGDLQLNDVSGSGSIGRGILELRAASGEWRRPVRVPLGPLHARVALTPRLEARLESLDASTGSSRIHLSGAIGALSDPQLDLAFEADVELQDAQLFGGPTGTTGRVHTRGRISGSPRDLRVEAQGKSPRVDMGGLTLHAVDADLELGGDTHQTLQLAVKIAASANDPWGGVSRGNATISGAYTPSSSRSELRWRAALERDDKAGAPGLGPGFVTATAEGTASGGTPLRIDGRMTGEVVSPTASGLRRVPFTGTFASLGRRIAADVDMRQAPGFLRASLDADAGAIKSLRLRGQDLDLLPLVGVGGRASLSAAFSGQPARASGAAAVKVQGLAYRGASLGDAELRLSLRNGSGPLQLQLPALRARGDGELRLAGGGSLSATLTLDRTPLQPLLASFSPERPQPLTGEVSAVADVTASLAEWRSAEVRLRASQVTLANGKLQARAGPFTALVRDGVADVQGLSIEVPGGRIEAAGRLALGAGSNDLVLRVAADVQNIPNLALPQGWQVQGRATGQLRLTGSHTRPWLVGNVQLVDMVVRRGQRTRIFELPKAELLAQGDRVVFAEVTASLAGGSLKSGGEIPLSTVVPALFPPADLARPAQLQVEWRDVQAAVLSRAFGWRGDQVVEAALSGNFTVQGSRARLSDLSGHGVMNAVHGTAAGVPFDVDQLAVRVERGIATLESFTLRTGTETLRGHGTLEARTLALTGALTGNVDLRALSALTSPAYLSGNAGVDVTLAGTLVDPRPSGSITLDRASARSPEFAQALTDLRGVLLVEPGLWRLEEVTGRFGGGDVLLAGSARPVGPSTWADVNFNITAKDVALRYPEDFKSRVSADLRLVGETGALQLVGGVLVDGGLYDKDIFLYQALMTTDESLLRPAASPLVEPLAPLRAIGLDIQARLVNPFLVRNNLAKLALTGQIRVRGDLAEPAPYGRLEIAEGGQVFLQTRTFTVEGGSVIYEGTREPTISVRAQGVIRQAGQEDVAVTVAASGPMERPHLTLNSDPPYTEREIASLIATGRRNVALDSSAWVAGEQGLALLAGPLTRNVQRGLLDLGLDEVDIQPELLARETNPGARFTFGKNITPDMKLIVSRGLKDPESTFYQLEYRMRALYNVTARIQSDDHASITYGLGQRFRWGGPKKPTSEVLQEKRVTLKAVTFTGDKPLGEDVLRDAIKVKVGEDVTPWDIQDDADRLERLLVDAQYIEALVSSRVEDDSAVFAITAGPRFRAEVAGMQSPPPLEDTLKEARFEGEALERGRKLLLDDARARGYGRATVDAAARDDAGWRTLSFKVELGAPAQVTVHFPGARALSAERLIEAAGGAAEFLTTPQRARRLVAREYRAALFLSVRVSEPEVVESPDHASVSIAVPVQEGPRAKIARVRFDGAQMPESVLAPLTGITPGSEYEPDKVLRAVQQVRDYYLKNGYAAVRLRHRLVPAAPDVEVHFQVSEGERDTIGPIVVTGLRRTRESLVRNRIDFKQGQPLDPRKLVELERRLMELGMFSRVAVNATGGNPSTIKVEVEERGPYMVNYDLRFSQDERATVLVDGEIGNLAGLGIVAGGRYRQGLALREARGSLVLPALGRARGITLSAFDREGDVGPAGEPRRKDSVGPFERRTERGAGLLHSLQLRNRWETVYSYTLKRVGTTAAGGLEKNLGVLDASIVADGRDDPLNPTRGTFWSVNVGLSPKQLGSQLPFSRAMGQLSWTLPVGRRLTWAQGYRVGVASVLRGKTLEEIRLIGRTEGFRAGGGSSVRGYATDSLGPKDLLPGTAAGDAVVIVNQELRYQLPAGFGAAVFYDAGNVFPRYEDLGLKLRHAVGVGARYLSPYGLVRVDLGFPVGRQPGERSYQIFLSLGQAF